MSNKVVVGTAPGHQLHGLPREEQVPANLKGEGCERGLVQIYGNCWICVCISSSHSLGVQRCAAPLARPSFSGPWCLFQPTTHHQQPTVASLSSPSNGACQRHCSRTLSPPAYHTAPVPYCRSLSFSAQHTHTRASGRNRRQMRGTATSLCQQTTT